jgi:release factor glutamine methyltransferase
VRRGCRQPPAATASGAETVATTLDATSQELTAAGFDEPRRRARRLLAAALDVSDAAIFAHPERQLAPHQQARVAEILRRVLAHEPLNRILGRREFWGLEFRLSPDTLDPRPETETLVESVMARLPDRARRYRFLDLGTGSGCILLALLSVYKRAWGVGVDLVPGAALTAAANARRLGLAPRAAFLAGNWAQTISGRFDAVIANPPYIAAADLADLPPEVSRYDPVRALDGGADGLAAYRAIAADLPRLLAEQAIFAGEIGLGQADAARRVLTEAGLRVDGIVPDLAGIERCIVARP